MQPKRAAIYLRVSTTKQAKGEVSIPSQRDLCTRFCTDKGFSIAAEFVDAGSATSDKERPEYRRMLQEADDREGRRFDVIVVHALSRFYRNAPISELTIRSLAKKGVAVESVTQTVGSDPNAAIGRQVIAIFDEYSSVQNSINVKRGMDENARQGFWNGARPPLGYRSVAVEQRGSKQKKRLQIEPNEASLVRKIFELYADGDSRHPPMGIARLVDWLNRQGYTTRLGARFGKGPIGTILRADYYTTGQFAHGAEDRETGGRKPESEIVYIPIPPIIDRPLFDRVQAKLTANNARNTPPRVVNGPCLLTGLARCARCGSSMTRTGTVRGRRRYSYYTCAGGHATGLAECRGRHKRMEQVDNVVVDAVRSRLLEPTKIVEIISALTAQLSNKEESGRQRLLHLEATVAETGTKLRRLYATIEDGTVELDDVLKGRISELRQELSRNQAELEKTRSALPRTIAIDAAKIEKFSRLVAEKLEYGDVNARKAYLRSFIDAVEIDDKRIRIIGRKSSLLDAVNGRSSLPRNVRGFDREWRTRQDSNL